MIIRRNKIIPSYTSKYPPAYSSTYCKATSEYAGGGFEAFRSFNPANTLLGNMQYYAWVSANASYTNQRLHVDLGAAYLISRIYYENAHWTGTNTDMGAKDVIIQGSNSATAFANLTYATNTDWTNLYSGTLKQHVAANQADPRYIYLIPLGKFRYYAFKFANNFSGTGYIGIRRIELQE